MQAFYEVRQYEDGFQAWYGSYTNMSFLAHWHREIELILIRRGQALIRVDDHLVTAHAGDLVVCDSGSIHFSDSYKMDNCLDFIVFDPALAHAVGQPLRLSSPLLTRERLADAGLSHAIEELFAVLQEELRARRPYYQEVVKGRLRESWFLLRRAFPPAGAPTRRDDTLRHLQDLLQYLDTHYDEPLTLEDAARRMHFSPSYFSRIFRELTGVRFVTYVQLLRAEQAAARLREGGASIAEVALSCGFSTLRTFNRVFKQVTSRRPSEFRKQAADEPLTLTYRTRKNDSSALVVGDSPAVVKNSEKIEEIPLANGAESPYNRSGI